MAKVKHFLAPGGLYESTRTVITDRVKPVERCADGMHRAFYGDHDFECFYCGEYLDSRKRVAKLSLQRRIATAVANTPGVPRSVTYACAREVWGIKP